MATKYIRVAVIYSPEKSHPKVSWFELNGEKATVAEECYYWESMEGVARLSHYSLNTDKGFFEIVFNGKEQIWRLK